MSPFSRAALYLNAQGGLCKIQVIGWNVRKKSNLHSKMGLISKNPGKEARNHLPC
jgi:hypothetical protein